MTDGFAVNPNLVGSAGFKVKLHQCVVVFGAGVVFQRLPMGYGVTASFLPCCCVEGSVGGAADDVSVDCSGAMHNAFNKAKVGAFNFPAGKHLGEFLERHRSFRNQHQAGGVLV